MITKLKAKFFTRKLLKQRIEELKQDMRKAGTIKEKQKVLAEYHKWVETHKKLAFHSDKVKMKLEELAQGKNLEAYKLEMNKLGIFGRG